MIFLGTWLRQTGNDDSSRKYISRWNSIYNLSYRNRIDLCWNLSEMKVQLRIHLHIFTFISGYYQLIHQITENMSNFTVMVLKDKTFKQACYCFITFYENSTERGKFTNYSSILYHMTFASLKKFVEHKQQRSLTSFNNPHLLRITI